MYLNSIYIVDTVHQPMWAFRSKLTDLSIIFQINTSHLLCIHYIPEERIDMGIQHDKIRHFDFIPLMTKQTSMHSIQTTTSYSMVKLLPAMQFSNLKDIITNPKASHRF